MISLTGSGEKWWGIISEVLAAGIRLPFEGKPHQFQIDDINRHARRMSCGYFWDIGLGKTTAGAITGGYHLLNGAERCYVLCPASLVVQWKETLDLMGFDALLWQGSPKERLAFGFDHDMIVMSFEIFQKDYPRIKDHPGYFVVDEATILSNPNNLFYKMINGGIVEKKRVVPGLAKPMIDKIQYPNLNNGACLLTATPSNNPADLYGLIKTVAPEIYTNEFTFKRLHVSEENVFGVPSAFINMDMLKDNLRSVASIRFAQDHLDMPEISYNVIEYDLHPAHLDLYNELLEKRLVVHDNKIVINALEATAFYNWAQKLVVNPDQAMFSQTPKVLEIMDTIVYNNPQTLIINKYVMSNDKMMKRYAKIGIGGCYGGLTRAQQIKAIKDFKEGRLRAFTVNPKSGGVGLNLQECCHNVVCGEIPVTSRDFRQALGRVYRQGQKFRVICTIPVARKTIQRTLLQNIMKKDEIMNQVLCSPKTLREDLFPKK